MSTPINPIAVPLVMTDAGPQPTPASTLRSAVTNAVAATNPNYTANLPGTLIEDLLSTEMGALTTIDQARVDAINSVSPYAANPYVLAQFGQMYGIMRGAPTNTNVDVVFSGPVGYVIPAGFIVSDGTYQYVVQDGTVIGSSGSSAAVEAIATQSGTWAVLAGSVTQIITSVDKNYTITVTNPVAGSPGAAAESIQSYQSRIIQAGLVTAQGTVNSLLTALQAIPGVTPRLVSIPQSGGTFKVLCGGGDPYAVANAIFQNSINFPAFAGSSNASLNITVTLTQPPNTYNITYISPAAQTVTMSVVWNTSQVNFTAGAQVNSLAQTALAEYINSIPVEQPINLLDAQSTFQQAVASVLPVQYLTSLALTVYINGTEVTPEAGTQVILSASDSYFSAAVTGITVTQG